MDKKTASFSLSVKGEGKIFLKGKRLIGKHVKTLDDVSDQGLVSILSNKKNAKILDKLEVKKNINENQTEFFKIVSNNQGDFNLKKTKEEIKDRTTITTKTFSDGGIEKIEKYDLSGKKLSEDIINQKENYRTYVEFYSNGKKKLELSRDNNQNYSFFEYDKKGMQTRKEPYFDGNDDFETVKNNNVLSKKTKFALDEQYNAEIYFRKLGIVTNENDIGTFNESLKLSDDIIEKIEIELMKKFGYKKKEEYSRAILEGKITQPELVSVTNSLLFAKRMEILKKQSSRIRKLETIDNITKYKIGGREFKVKTAREFGESDRLRVSFENGESVFTLNEQPLKAGKYYFTAPNKGGIYIFDDTKGEHHSNFPLDSENNPDFSVVAAGCFILDEKGKVTKVVNDSGHFKPKSKDCTESFLRCVSKEMQRTGAECSVTELLSDKTKTEDGGYSLSVDITKCKGDIQNRGNITVDSIEPKEAISVISKRRLELIDEKMRNKSMNLV